MGRITKRYLTAAMAVCAAIGRLAYPASADPALGAPVFGIAPGAAQLSLVNCEDTNFVYVVQTSTNLQDWASVTTNFATGSNSPVTVPAPGGSCFYRVSTMPHAAVPLFGYAIVTSFYLVLNGNNITVDSFDSSNPIYSTAGQYDATKRKAGGDMATDSTVVGSISVGNGNIYGHIYTGPGTGQSTVQIGPDGAVGDTIWDSSNFGIEAGHWSGNFYVNFPDVPTPTFIGLALPPADTNGVITLNGGNFIAASDPAAAFNVTAPTTLWVQGSFSPHGVTIANTNNASLVLYIGTANTNGNDVLHLGGIGPFNQPGYAANLQFYCLSSVTNVSVSGNNGFVGTIYAPEATVTGGGGGNNTADYTSAMIVKAVVINGHWNLHYDEHLRISGPTW